jgi:hypothetical protein
LGDITKLVKETLTLNDTDPDGDKLTVISPSVAPQATANGGTVQTDSPNSAWLYYFPPAGATNNATDSFTYVITDSFGGTATATVNVLIKASNVNEIPRNKISENFAPDGSGSVVIRFAGISGRKYKVQASTTFVNPNWQDLPMNDLTVGAGWTLDTEAPFAPGTYNPTNNSMTANAVGFIEYKDIDAPLFRTRFYRAILTQ